MLDRRRAVASSWRLEGDTWRVGLEVARLSETDLAPELEPDPTGGTCFVTPPVGGLVHDVKPEAADSVWTVDARLDEPDLSRRRGLFHLHPDMLVVGLDHHAHDIPIPQSGVANSVGSDLTEGQTRVVVSPPQRRRGDDPVEGGSSEERGLIVGRQDHFSAQDWGFPSLEMFDIGFLEERVPTGRSCQP
ncbi:MAG TPA: hypothetical protein VFI59_11980 [Actinomycetota bacterium]|nr:hypothetical protein [Actinomycetota bacterium]